MKTLLKFFFIGLFAVSCQSPGKDNDARITDILSAGWYFHRGDLPGSLPPSNPDSSWMEVEVPHDWAIAGPFSKDIDIFYYPSDEKGKEKQLVPVPGLTGGLPHTGTGWYQRIISLNELDKEKRYFIEFDGAMSHAKVFLNGTFIGEWPYGYSSFSFDLTPNLVQGNNILAVRLENPENASRWYPGAGLYREVRLVTKNMVYIPQWGVYAVNKIDENGDALLSIKTSLVNLGEGEVNIKADALLMDRTGKVLAKSRVKAGLPDNDTIIQELMIAKPELWSIDNPVLYTLLTRVYANGKVSDEVTTKIGFREARFDVNSGFLLNGRVEKLKGVCLHHDLGGLGAAFNVSAMRHQLLMLKEMGCNAIRTSHNPPAPQLLDLCDEMGFVVMDEAFDEWKVPKVKNGYSLLFDEWGEKDLRALIRRDRNHPSVVLWSIGNEILEQLYPEGAGIARRLVGICRQEDPSRLVTAGINIPEPAMQNGLMAELDVIGLNYKPHLYDTIRSVFPDKPILSSESASTVSSRGKYYFPLEWKVVPRRPDSHCNSYDTEHPRWATTPDKEFAAQDDRPWVAGEFVWTGFDYLGEPTPYGNPWPTRSSYFGIIDLGAIPKDRYFLYQSNWNPYINTLHILPHWNWEGNEGKPVPVVVYTNNNKAELFLNGKSLGIREKDRNTLETRYRITWNDVPYEPGELKAVSIDDQGNRVQEATVRTAGKPARIILTSRRSELQKGGTDLAYIYAYVLDKDGNICPLANNEIEFSIDGNGKLKAVNNGDPTCIVSFHSNKYPAFGGQCTAIVASGKQKGSMVIKAKSEGLEEGSLLIEILN